jgi:hypothetical protein
MNLNSQFNARTVAQVSKLAVSPMFKSAGRRNDAAAMYLEVCATAFSTVLVCVPYCPHSLRGQRSASRRSDPVAILKI